MVAIALTWISGLVLQIARHANLVSGSSRDMTAFRDFASVSSLVHFKSFCVLKTDINNIFREYEAPQVLRANANIFEYSTQECIPVVCVPPAH